MMLRTFTYKEEDSLQHAMSLGQLITRHRKQISEMKFEACLVAKLLCPLFWDQIPHKNGTYIHIKKKITCE